MARLRAIEVRSLEAESQRWPAPELGAGGRDRSLIQESGQGES
jgi:hypothetical protein